MRATESKLINFFYNPSNEERKKNKYYTILYTI